MESAAQADNAGAIGSVGPRTSPKTGFEGRVVRAALTVSVLTTIAKAVATMKELMVARTFGTSDALDAFIVAVILPTFAVNVVGGSFNTALIPVFIRVRDREGRSSAQSLLGNVMVFGLLFLTVVAICLFLASGALLPLLGSSFSAEKVTLSRHLLAVVLPTLILSGVGTTWSGVLNAEQRFSVPALATVITPLVILLLLGAYGERFGVYCLAIGTLVGAFIEVTVLGYSLTRIGYSILPAWSGATDHVKDVLRQYAPMAGGAMLLSSTSMIDQAMAATLGSGQVSALVYGNRVVGLMLSIASLGLGTAIFPYFSSMVASGKWSEIRRTLRKCSLFVFIGSCLVTILLIAFSEPLISLLYERKNFTGDDTRLVSAIQRAYSLQIPFYLLGTLFVRLISSLRANQILMYGAVISLILDIVLNWLFMNWFGAPGIGYSTTVVYLVSAVFLGFMLTRLLREAVAENG